MIKKYPFFRNTSLAIAIVSVFSAAAATELNQSYFDKANEARIVQDRIAKERIDNAFPSMPVVHNDAHQRQIERLQAEIAKTGETGEQAEASFRQREEALARERAAQGYVETEQERTDRIASKIRQRDEGLARERAAQGYVETEQERTDRIADKVRQRDEGLAREQERIAKEQADSAFPKMPVVHNDEHASQAARLAAEIANKIKQRDDGLARAAREAQNASTFIATKRVGEARAVGQPNLKPNICNTHASKFKGCGAF